MNRAVGVKKRPGQKAGGGRNSLRIIGGTWRGRRLSFPDVEGLRPSPDRVRETLFNWLQPVIEGARCLDLFAGSGALGFEALSRGAAEAVLVDRDREVVTVLREHARVLEASGATVVEANAQAYLAGPPRPFDLVFMDPPFRADLLAPLLARLAEGWVHAGTRIYIEAEVELDPLPLPTGWTLLRRKQAGQVAYHLVLAG